MKPTKIGMSGKEVAVIAKDCIARISRRCQELDWADPNVYAAWLSQTYGYVRYTTRFIAFAAGRCSLEQEAIFSKLVHGLGEEKGHELLAIRDLESLGRRISEFRECPETAAYHQTLFRNVDVHGPVALLGYSIPLEGVAATAIGPILRTVVKTYGDEGTHFLRAHSELDEGHFAEALAHLDGMDAAGLSIVARHLELSTALYLGIIGAIPGLAQETAKDRRRLGA